MLAPLLALAVLQATGPAPRPARTRIVGPAGYPTLAAAVAAATAGDTVRIRGGRHVGLATIDRPLVVIGDAGAVLDGARQGTVVTVRADSVVLRGFAVRGSGRSLDHDQAAVKLERCTGCRVEDLVITDPLHGIYLLESHDVTVTGNTVTGAADLAESRRGNGIHLFNSTGNRIERNRIRGTRDGIYFSFASHNRVLENDVARVRYGLHYMYSDDNRFERNVFAENAAGAAIMFSRRIVLRENVFTRHVGYRAYGILLQTATQVLIEGNQIEGNLTGLFLDMATADTFRANVIRGNWVGIDLMTSADGNVFTGNTITENRIAVRTATGGGDNAWDEHGVGNFWGDPRVVDLDGDGIGDQPYRVGDPFIALAAERPALELFAGTLAARALAWAEEAFPVFGIARIEDRRPLAVPPSSTDHARIER